MKRINNHLTKLGAGTLALLALGNSALAQSSDALLDKLVEKGILSVREATDLKEESDKDFKKSLQTRNGMQDWTESLKINGDFRTRYDGIYQDDHNYGPKPAPVANTFALEDRTRFRYRLRLGVTAGLTDSFEVGLRLGSGELNTAAPTFGGNIFSANTTFNNDASRKFLFVDLAYAKWSPKPWFEAQVGKMLPGFWLTDMILDPDYNPEGAQEKLTFDVAGKHKLSFTSGQWVIAENFNGNGAGNNNDTYLFANQVDWTAKWSKKFSTRLGAAALNFKNQRDLSPAIETFVNQNGTPAVGSGSQNFNPVIGRLEATYNLESFPMYSGEFPITLGGEYVVNPAADDQKFTGKNYSGRGNKGYNLGLQLGSAKAKGNWQVSYNYKNIETAATWHGLNDDDFGFNTRGGTDVRGHQVIASYHVADPLLFNVRYMRTEQIANPVGTKAEQQRLFLDLVWSF